MPDATPATPTTLKIALWANNLAHPVKDRAQWLALVEAQVAAAKAEGADLLVMPEYVSAHWLNWADGPGSGQSVMNWMAAEGRALLPELELMAMRHRIGLVAGSMPVLAAAEREDLGTVNRAWILLPQEDGTLRRLHHDKLVPTPMERVHGEWPIRLGGRVAPFEFRGAKLAVLICLDVEMPAVAAKLQAEALDLLIVPSMTAYLSGYHRVFDCAKARAIELFCAVGAVGAIGAEPQSGAANCSGASLFLPCEMTLGATGRAAEVAPQSRADGPGPMLVAEVPVAALRRARRHAEAWPGPFDAADIAIGEDAVAHIPRFDAAQ